MTARFPPPNPNGRPKPNTAAPFSRNGGSGRPSASPRPPHTKRARRAPLLRAPALPESRLLSSRARVSLAIFHAIGFATMTCRKNDQEGRSLSRRRANLDTPAVAIDDVLDDGEAEARP